ncbi:MAG TPA: uroporphyrinogen-III C-methyltransferase [Planctomycetota bacterium]|nr:uroporphyrinogen-III C-methyltransferase [Planctomycetota bacterium]
MPIVPGTVFLAGAGPGDPGLLTLRAAELLTTCDCVVYDYLVNPAILTRIPAHVERHFVGKRGGRASASQDEINRMLIELAHKHRRVLRLKGGDPFLFGRGGEEAAALAEAGVPFEVVPGVTSGIGVPAYAGIPVTHRAASSVVAFATGHQAKGETEDLDWAGLARIETVVLYMGMHKLAQNCASLIAHGRAADTPACAIQWGSYARQRVVVGTLATLPQLAIDAKLGAPAITVIGDVVWYREKIRWFDNRPLSGRRVVVTRLREQASELSDLLGRVGAEVVEAPVARQEAPASWDDLDGSLRAMRSFRWVVFTSANAVRFTWERLRVLGMDARAFANSRIAAIGPSTATVLASHGLTADLVPHHYDAASLAAALVTRESLPPSVLLPQADNARFILRDHLRAAGCTVTTSIAYRTVPEPFVLDPELPIDAVTFASSATVDRFVAGLGKERVIALIAAGCRYYAIGPQTAATMTANGLPIAAMAEEATIPALVQAVVRDLATA